MNLYIEIKNQVHQHGKGLNYFLTLRIKYLKELFFSSKNLKEKSNEQLVYRKS